MHISSGRWMYGLLLALLTSLLWGILPIKLKEVLQVMDPAFFAGLDAFTDQADWTAAACRDNPPAAWNKGAVRMPGDSAARKRQAALSGGVPVGEATWEKLSRDAERLGVAMPATAA